MTSMKLEAKARLTASKIQAAPIANLTTSAGLTKFLTDQGFNKTTGTKGYQTYHKSKGGKRPLSEIKKVWKTQSSKPGNFSIEEVLEYSGVTIRVSLMKEGDVYVMWEPVQFKNADKTDIYDVTKYHPAWIYVQDYCDEANNKSKATVKKAVDMFMKEFGFTQDALKDQIVQRTRIKKVDKLYQTD